MQTEQEQIKRMAEIIKIAAGKNVKQTGVMSDGTLYYVENFNTAEDCAELLIKAGYGDVSEYKTEIAKLKQYRTETLVNFASRLMSYAEKWGNIAPYEIQAQFFEFLQEPNLEEVEDNE